MPTLVRSSSEEEMVLEFARAELDSEVYSDRCTIPEGHSRVELIDKPNLANLEHNRLRLNMLWYRGYPTRELLFTGFARSAEWNLCLFSSAELGECRYANCPPWSDVGGMNRLVRIGAETLEVYPSLAATAEIVSKIGTRYAAGDEFPTLIAAEVDDSHVLVEGHKRATAFVGSKVNRSVMIIVGKADEFKTWRFR